MDIVFDYISVTTFWRIMQEIEIPPASLAASGSVVNRSQFSTPRAVKNSKISMLIPAATMSDIFSQSVTFKKYATAWLMNMSDPVNAAITKAVHVHGKTTIVSSVTGCLMKRSPSKRRSTIAIDAIKSEIATT